MKTLVKSNGSLFPAIPSLFNDLFNKDWLDPSLVNWKTSGATLPAANVKETKEKIVIELAVPGMKRDNFRVELRNNILSISAEVQEPQPNDEQESYTHLEFSYLSFNRSFTLPDRAEVSKISARYNNGILFITVPKREEGKIKPPKVIGIS